MDEADVTKLSAVFPREQVGRVRLWIEGAD